MYQTGREAWDSYPTTLVVKRSKKGSGYTDKFLVQEGCEEGTTITMTKNSSMDEEAWKGMTPKFVEGYRNMPVV